MKKFLFSTTAVLIALFSNPKNSSALYRDFTLDCYTYNSTSAPSSDLKNSIVFLLAPKGIYTHYWIYTGQGLINEGNSLRQSVTYKAKFPLYNSTHVTVIYYYNRQQKVSETTCR